MNTKEWVNIPGSYLLASYLCTLSVMIFSHSRKKGMKQCTLTIGIVGVIYAVVLFLNPMAEGFQFFLCMGTIWAGMTVAFRVCTGMPWLAAGCYTVRAFFAGDFCASLFWQLVHYVMTHLGIGDKVKVTFLVAVPGYVLYFGILTLIEKHFCKETYELEIRKKDLAWVLFIGIFFYFMANISYVLPDSPFSAPGLAETYAYRTLTEFGAAAILLAYHLRIVDLKTRLQVQAMENMWQRQEEHYKTYEASIALVNQKYHDLKHQLHLLQENVGENEKLEYIRQMEKELEEYEAQNKTGNSTLDTVLTAKSLECMKEGIQFTCVCDGKALGEMQPLDINALFGNILDNAIECEKNIPDPEKRLIHPTASRKKGWIRISARNICEEEPVFKAGFPVSTKGDPQLHGYGTASMQSIVEKYNGNMILKWEDGWFEVNILIPSEAEARGGSDLS